MSVVPLTSSEMAANAVETSDDAREALVTLSSGAVIKVFPPKTRLIIKLHAENPKPEVPKFEYEQGGKQLYTENPDDPDYKKALQEYNQRIYNAHTKLIVLTSTQIVSLPDGCLAYEDDKDWVEEMDAIGFSTKFANKTHRWLEWFFYRICSDEEDINQILDASAKLQGVTEEAVKATEETTFQDNS